MMADSPPEDCSKGELSFGDSHRAPSCSTPTVNEKKSPPSIGDLCVVAASCGVANPSVIFSNETSNLTCITETYKSKLFINFSFYR